MIIGGIDPGVTGGICKLDTEDGMCLWGRTPVIKTQTTKKTKKGNFKIKTDINIKYIRDFFRGCDRIAIEKSQSMPGEGSVSSFSYGKNYGQYIGWMKSWDLDFEEVHPISWKTFFKKKYYKISEKKESIRLAVQLSGVGFIPDGCRTANDGCAEAYLIAVYLWEKYK